MLHSILSLVMGPPRFLSTSARCSAFPGACSLFQPTWFLPWVYSNQTSDLCLINQPIALQHAQAQLLALGSLGFTFPSSPNVPGETGLFLNPRHLVRLPPHWHDGTSKGIIM